MSAAGYFFGVTLLSVYMGFISASFQRCISCSCGSSDQNYTHCFAAPLPENFSCDRWSNCQTCKANATFCVTCPPHRFGPLCSKSEPLRRIRRQEPNLFNYPRQYGRCPPLERPDSGSLRCTQTGNERTCTARCLPGYHFEGEENAEEITLRCYDRVWTPRRFFPTCRPGGHCEVRVTGAGFYNCTIDMDGTHCDITCDGWQQGRFHCYPGRRWDPPLPYCTVPKGQEACHCQNGGICDEHGRCKCPQGRTGTHCESSERQRATCPDPGIPRYGSRLNPNGSDASYPRVFEEGESVIFTCNEENMALQGSSFITCLANGTWSANRPRCVKTAPVGSTVYCPDPGFIQFGSRINADSSDTRLYTRYTSGQSLVFYCNEGYELVGSSIMTCLASGRWSAYKPACRSINVTRPTVVRERPAETSCRHPGVDVNGVIEEHALLDPRRRGQTFPAGTELRFRCNEGFELEGETLVTCQPSGEWSAAPPACKETFERPQGVCKHPGVDVNGRIETQPLDQESRRMFPVDTELAYSCNDGYEPEGPTVIYCMNSGEWTSVPPSCRRITEPSLLVQLCPAPRVDPNAEIEELRNLDPRKLPGFEPGHELTFNCRDGYDLEGSNIIQCLQNGQWSNLSPTCTPRIQNPGNRACPPPKVDPNGIVEEFLLDPRKLTQSFENGTELTFRCRSGYVLEGWSTIRCSSSGRWSSPSPRCHLKSSSSPVTASPTRCENPGPISHGRMHVFRPPGELSQPSANEDDDFPFGTHIKYKCDDGFYLVGDDSMSCESNSYWSVPTPMCVEARI